MIVHHAKDGWRFLRNAEGSVIVDHGLPVAPLLELSADEWVSVMTSLAHESCSAQAHAAAARLHLGPPPPASEKIHCAPIYTGWHRLLGLLPEAWQARYLGWCLMRAGGQWHGVDLEAVHVILRFPSGSFRVVDEKGRVEPARPPALPGGVA